MSVEPARPHHLPAIVSPNPRRRPACSSVSLRHAPSAKANSRTHTASSLANNNGSPAGSSNSQTWFDTSNNNPVPRRTSPIDHEPPFFLPDSSSATPYNTTNVVTANGSHGGTFAPRHPANFGPERSRRDADEGTLDDFRSVIDDLTVQNKKLLKRLRRFEKVGADHLQSERLFEVKIHGLSATKKHELEETLKRFALGLGNVSSRGSSRANAATVSQSVNAPKPSSSLTSTKFADSGYGSMSASHRPLTHRSSSSVPAARNAQSGAEASKARERNIHSYLHDIPEGLLPRESPAVMTEEAKKRLVVARLEQLFHGSGATADGHQQPIQQQEVSQLAAKDDRSAMEAKGQRAQAEGTREALIMDENTDTTTNAAYTKKHAVLTSEGSACRTGYSSNSSSADGGVLEQRPTRPLDLDPHRAQDPSENVGYIRHLGFQMPDVMPHAQSDDSHGWIYLNLLINMAQLHTLNVTTSLVTDALRTYSRKFELSEDCRKIRWHPRSPPSDMVNAVDYASSGPVPSSKEHTNSGLKRSLPPQFDRSASQQEHPPSKKRTISRAASSKVSYTSLWPHSSERNLDNDDDEYGVGSGSDPSLPSVAEYPGDSPLDPMDAVMSNSTVSQDEGALIFLNNQRFFLDLSGDRTKHAPRWSDERRQTINTRPLGSSSAHASSVGELSGTTSSQVFAASDSGSLEVHTDEEKGSEESKGLDTASCDNSESSPPVINLDASGLGHVYPADNFVFFVRRDAGPSVTLKDVLEDPATRSAPRASNSPRLVSVQRRTLSPSRLPSPTYAVTPDDEDDDDSDSTEQQQDIQVSSSEDESMSEDSHDPTDDSKSEANTSHRSFSTSPHNEQLQPSLYHNDSTSKQVSDDDDNQDTQSLDFLATARAADPAAIQAREREYDAELAERLAEEIPAGSSAATCGGGGGSGYNSPATGIRRRLDRKSVTTLAKEQDRYDDDDDGSISS